MTTTTVEANGLTFDVDLYGHEDGTPVLLLHGWPQDSRSWRPVAERLAAEGLRAIAPNQRGYSPGARPEGSESYTTTLLAQDVADIAAALGYDEFHLVGHDWGAAVSWVVATDHADRVLSLTAVSVPHLVAYNEALTVDDDQKQRASYIQLLRQVGTAERVLLENDAARLRAMYGGDVPAEDEQSYAERFQEPGVLTATLNWYRAMGSDLASTPDVTVPTTFIWGESDLALGRYGAVRTGDHVKADYKFVQVDGGHWLPDTHPDLLATEILARVRG